MLHLYGASGHAKVIIEIAELLSEDIGSIIDDNRNVQSILDYDVIHEVPYDVRNLIISIGNNRIRKKIYNRFSHLHFPVLIHPHTAVSRRGRIGKGTVIMAGVSVNSGADIGDHVILNTNCSVDHDCIINAYVHISPNAALAGNVIVGEGSHIGIGASVIQGISIGKWCTIGAGAVVINDIPDHSTVVGNPGRIIKSNKNFSDEF